MYVSQYEKPGGTIIIRKSKTLSINEWSSLAVKEDEEHGKIAYMNEPKE